MDSKSWKLFPDVTRSGHGDRKRAVPSMETGLLFSSLGWARLGLHNALCLSLGLAVDYHNERLYWADAKLSVIGSIRLNGTDPIVAADSKRGQPLRAASASPALGPLIFLTKSKALPSICHFLILVPSSPAVPSRPHLLPSRPWTSVPALHPLAHLPIHSLHRVLSCMEATEVAGGA